MDDLIAALTLAKKYANEYQLQYPTNCSHDELLLNIDASMVTAEDLERFEELGFHVGEYGLVSFRFGSC